MKKIITFTLLLSLTASLILSGCTASGSVQNNSQDQTTSDAEKNTDAQIKTADGQSNDTDISADTKNMDFSFSGRDMEVGYDESTATKIVFHDTSATVDGEGATADTSGVNISAEGTYILSGSLTNGTVTVNAPDTAKIQLVFDNVSLCCQQFSPLFIEQADKVFITLAEGSKNTLSDGASYQTSSDTENVDGVIFSRSDLTINGTGALTVNGNYKHGIVSKDDLIITGGTFDITANGQGLSGKDCLKIADGTFNIDAQGDGLQSSNIEDADRGFVYIRNGSFTIKSASDGIQAETALIIEDGDYDIDAEDDTVHCNGAVSINEGVIRLSAKDDAIHAETTLAVAGGVITAAACYEGLEGQTITISGGEIDLTSEDDGINAASPSTGSSTMQENAGFKQERSFGRGGGMGMMEADENCLIQISGGTIRILAGGDGIDSNGSIQISGGDVYVDGPENDRNSSLDYGISAEITGGIFLAAGSAGMAEGFSQTSAQYSVFQALNNTFGSSDKITLCDDSGTALLEYTPRANYNCVIISMPELKDGDTYTLKTGAASTSLTASSGNGSSMGGRGGFGGKNGQGGFGGRGNMGDANGMTPPNDAMPSGAPDDLGGMGGQGGFGGRGNMGDANGMTPPNDAMPSGAPDDLNRSDMPDGITPPDDLGGSTI